MNPSDKVQYIRFNTSYNDSEIKDKLTEYAGDQEKVVDEWVKPAFQVFKQEVSMVVENQIIKMNDNIFRLNFLVGKNKKFNGPKQIEIYFTEIVLKKIAQFKYDTLENLATFWKKTRDKFNAISLMASYYLDLASKGQITKLDDIVLVNLRKIISESFQTDLINSIIMDFNGQCVERFILKTCIDIIGNPPKAKPTDRVSQLEKDFFDKLQNVLCSFITEKASISLEKFNYFQDCFDRYNLTDMGNTVLINAFCIPIVSQNIANVQTIFKNLQCFYKLSKYISLESLTNFGNIIKNHVIQSIKDKTTIPQMIEQNKYYQTILDLLEKDSVVLSCIHEGFSKNLFESFSEVLAIYIDKLFSQKMSDDEFEIEVKNCIQLAQYIIDKDEFFLYYKKLFCRRLLNKRNIELERITLSFFKSTFPLSFIHSLEVMFKDVETSDSNLTVITQGIWPSFPMATIPKELIPFADKFREEYKQKFANRSLKFVLVGSLEIKYGKYVLHTNIPQGFILLSLSTPKTIEAICQETSIPPNQVGASLEALTMAKHPVLVKKDGLYYPNNCFKNKTWNVKISTITKKETGSEKTETRQKLDEGRNFSIDAAIVRIMKSEKTLDYNNIVIQVATCLKRFFNVEPAMIKKCIESLIEREYLAREDDNKSFTYIA